MCVISYITSFVFVIFLSITEDMMSLFRQNYREKGEKNLKYYLDIGIIISFIEKVLVYLFTLVMPFYNLFAAEQYNEKMQKIINE